MFRFTIRELILLTLVAALGVGWWMERARSNRLAGRERYLLQAIERAGYEPSGDYIGPDLIKKDG